MKVEHSSEGETLRAIDYLKAFRMPTPMKITGRSSSITNAFINAIVPVIQPTADEVKQVLDILGMTPETMECTTNV